MEFIKMHGTGNDFIIINDISNKLLGEEIKLAKNICHRRFGIGADGLVLIRKSEIAHMKMDIINSDGSKANMCGNAIRCFAKYLYENNLVNESIISVETGDGIKTIEVFVNKKNKVELVKVCMGEATYDGSKIPLINKDTLINEKVIVNDKEYFMTSVLVGVPHTIIFVNDENYSVNEGKYIEKSSIFKYGTNVNFVKILNDSNIEVTTWERGAGATLSCGTGASASVAVSNKFGYTGQKVNVRVPGGNLIIELENNKIFMSGPAEYICKGIVLL